MSPFPPRPCHRFCPCHMHDMSRNRCAHHACTLPASCNDRCIRPDYSSNLLCIGPTDQVLTLARSGSPVAEHHDRSEHDAICCAAHGGDAAHPGEGKIWRCQGDDGRHLLLMCMCLHCIWPCGLPCWSDGPTGGPKCRKTRHLWTGPRIAYLLLPWRDVGDTLSFASQGLQYSGHRKHHRLRRRLCQRHRQLLERLLYA